MSGLHLYIGRANTDKTDALYDAVLTHIRRGDSTYLIVPKQATFAAERRLAEATGGGMFGATVLSMDRLCGEVLKSAADPLPYLSEQGMSMTLRRIAESNAPLLRAFGSAIRRQGFCSELSSVISTIKHSSISPDALQETMDRLQDGTILKDKLHDILLLYRESGSFLESRFLTEDDRILSAISYLPSSKLAGSYVFFDEIPEMSGLFYQFLETLLNTAALVTIGITDDPDGNDEELFLPVRTAEEEIMKRAASAGVQIRTERYYRSPQHDKALLHLEKHFFVYPYRQSLEGTDHLHLISAPSYQAESDAVCDAVLQNVKNGLRFRDIAIVVTDLQAYEITLQRSLNLRGIPFFLDKKRPALLHPAANLVQSALAAVSEGFAASEMLELAKSGFAGLARSESEAFDNHVLRYGIRGNGFLSEFRGKDMPEEAELARRKLVTPLLALREALRGRTVREKLSALYSYLVDISLPGQLEARADALIENGMPREAEEHAELWKLMTELFDQLYVILGDTEMGRDDFLSLIREGLSGLALGVIPDTADRVLIGDTSRTRLPDSIRALYVMGATDGALPRSRYDDGIIDNGELELLAQNGLSVWQKTDFFSASDLLLLYQIFSTPSDELTLSFSQSSGSSELTPSSFVARMKDMFHLEIRFVSADTPAVPATEKTALRMLSEFLRTDVRENRISGTTAALLEYFRNHPDYADFTGDMLHASSGIISPDPLGRKLSELLYGQKLDMAPTRLELFNKCPFRHFLSAGLGAKKRSEATVGALEEGTFYHAMLQAFLVKCTEEQIDLKHVTDEQVDLITEEIAPEVIAQYPDRILDTNERAKATLFLLLDNASACIHALVKQFRNGSFVPFGAEIKFGDGEVFPAIMLNLGDGRTARLHGVIDRIDTVADGAKQFARVVDYKTHGRKFDYGAILDGIELQLPLYMQAVTAAASADPAELRNRVLPAGSYYMPVVPKRPDEAEAQTDDPDPVLQLEGVTVSDPFIIESSDEKMESSSEILHNVRRNKDGTLRGSLCTYNEMDRLLKKAVEIAEQTTRRILSGNIAIDPVSSFCQYCDFRSVCRFDLKLPNCHTRKRTKATLKAFFESAGKEGRQDELE